MHPRIVLRMIAGMLAMLGAGCQLVLGLGEVVPLEVDGGPGGTGGEQSGAGGHPAPSFAFAITDASVNVPYDGLGFVDLQITPSGGFDNAIEVTPQGAPAGLVAKPLTIPAGSMSARLEVGANATLVLGTTFTLTLAASSGGITKTASAPAVVTGQPGTLDMSFGSGGVVMGPGNTGEVDLRAIVEVPDSTILVGGLSAPMTAGGDAIALRYSSTGMPDTAFNGTGSVSNSYCSCTPGEGGTLSIAREADGTLLFIGWGQASLTGNENIFLFRYNDDGTMNAVLGDTGTEDIGLGSGNETVTAAALVPNSTKVVVVGSTYGQPSAPTTSEIFVARIPDRDAFGAPDKTFVAPNGWIAPPVGGVSSSAGALTLDAAGNIVVTGWVDTGAAGYDVLLLRLTPDGALDSTFGNGGWSVLTRTGDQHGSAILVQPDGNIVVAADTDETGTLQLLLQRFLPSGAPDPAFGTNGVALAPLFAMPPPFVGLGEAWLVQLLDGRLVVAGNGTLGGTTGQVFARFLPDGTPDPTFGTNGEMVVFIATNAFMEAMSLDSSGKLLVSGTIESDPGGSFIARVWN
jgi:uncharacterized delta-60 repeat protein